MDSSRDSGSPVHEQKSLGLTPRRMRENIDLVVTFNQVNWTMSSILVPGNVAVVTGAG
jgi:hypothetical protein